MPKDLPPSSPPVSNAERPATASHDSPLSLSRLRDAFASMLGTRRADNDESHQAKKTSGEKSTATDFAVDTPCEVNPRSVVESMLFVGRPDNGPISARELAAVMRGVSPAEIETAGGGPQRGCGRGEGAGWVRKKRGGEKGFLLARIYPGGG